MLHQPGAVGLDRMREPNVRGYGGSVGRRDAGESLASWEAPEKEREKGFKRVLSVVGGAIDKDGRKFSRGDGGHAEGRPLTAREEEIATREFECQHFHSFKYRVHCTLTDA